MQDNLASTQANELLQTSTNESPLARRSSAYLIVAVAAAAFFGWFAWDTHNSLNEMRSELTQKLGDANDRAKQTLAIANQARQDTKEGLAKLSVVENKLAESQNQQVALEALYQELSKSRDDISISEIEDVLDLASQQLQLAGNVKSALIALQSVDAKLAKANNKPRWTQLRRAINQDMERLKATPFVDTIAISAKLDSLMTNIDNLPLLSDPVSVRDTQNASFAIEPKGFWSRFSKEVLVDLGELVRVRNLEKPDVPLLSPSQAYFLRENFRLRLLNARLALLSRNEASFKGDITAASQWLKAHFDTKIKAVTSAQATLKQLAESSISISVPDITSSLEAIHIVRQSNERGSR